ncbi:phage head-tail connector protein [Weissella cibaria]|uniref:phage head-tail connector protein n=1 Tax=Weissella cibaria TaxID=137591 RepID=UPI001C1F5653|nr:hypothetical protein [Weissella cibaria]MBU7544741.1 hypothetical protein [Weissella cibaria]MCV3317718.1 hypothetical protein [Weissella cibaria]
MYDDDFDEPEDYSVRAPQYYDDEHNGEVLWDLKQRLEIDDDSYDQKLMSMVSSGIATLQMNGVPVGNLSSVKSQYDVLCLESFQEGYLSLVLDFLEVYLTLNFDRGEITGVATLDYLQTRYVDLLYMLKGIFDVAQKDQPFNPPRSGQYHYRRGTTIGDRDDQDARNAGEDFRESFGRDSFGPIAFNG